MFQAIQSVLFPFWVAWRVCCDVWNVVHWVRSSVKAWRRKPAYGEADWATDKELKKAGLAGPEGYCIGRRGKRLIFSHRESCVLTQGARGVGKSLTMGATINRASRETLVVFDPPGGLYDRFGDELRTKGYQVRLVDFDRPLDGEGYDPFAMFEKSGVYRLPRDMRLLADLVVGERPKGDAGEHFADMSATLIAGAASYLWSSNKATACLRDVAYQVSVGGPNVRMRFFSGMRMATSDPAAAIAVNAFEEAGDREKGSFATTLGRKLWPWVTPAYVDVCRKGWSWDDVFTSDQPQAVFLVGGIANMEAIAPLVRVFFGQAAGTLGRLYADTRKALDRPVKLLVDEAASIGNCRPMMDVITEMRKAGVTCFLAYQDLGQVREAFGREASTTIINNCDLLINGGVKVPGEYDWLGKILGQRTIKPMNKGKGGESFGEAPRFLAPADALYGLPPGEHVCLLKNLAVRCEKPFQIRNGVVEFP